MSWNDIPDWALEASACIMEAVRQKDPETFHHCLRVGRNAGWLAKLAGLNAYEQKVAEFSGVFHDIGKVGVPDSVLFKPAKLTPDEFELMRAHPEKSVEMLKPLTYNPFFKDLIPGVLHHHERYEGRGYPHDLKQDNIPLAARIILIVDTMDAMTVTRAYRKGLSIEQVYEELRLFSGTQFDPHLVKIFLEAHPKLKSEPADDVAHFRMHTLRTA